MACGGRRPAGDRELVQIVDAAFAEAAQRSGNWLVCRPGCTQCCVGVFEINALDAARLRAGLEELTKNDPHRAGRVRQRAQEARERLRAEFPGDPETGVLADDDASRERFEEFGNDEVCPALDPATGMCDLYAHRPMTCRVFGPPIRSEGGLAVCELCFDGATAEEIAAAEMNVHADLEERLLAETGDEKKTIVAFCLADSEL